MCKSPLFVLMKTSLFEKNLLKISSNWPISVIVFMVSDMNSSPLHPAIYERYGLNGPLRYFTVVGDDHDRGPLLASQVQEQVGQHSGIRAVEIPGRLVREDDVRLSD